MQHYPMYIQLTAQNALNYYGSLAGTNLLSTDAAPNLTKNVYLIDLTQ